MKLKIVALFCFMAFTLSMKAQNADTLTIYFNINQSIITKENAVMIDSFFAKNSRYFILKSIDLFGYCDKSGSNIYNDHLSYRRVDFTKKYLEMLDINPLIFGKIKGYGKHKIGGNLANNKSWLNRCVKVIVYRGNLISPTLLSPEFEIKKTLDISDNINDSALKIGSNIILTNLNFIGNSHYPLRQSIPVLDEILKAFQTNSKLKVEIQGFVCCTPENEDGFDRETRTFDLSIQRAKYVFDYLVKKGVASSRMEYRGMGVSHSYFPDELNRRVEFKILDK